MFGREEFTVLMESFMGRIAAKIEVEADKIARNFERPERLPEVDVDAEIERYFARVEQ